MPHSRKTNAVSPTDALLAATRRFTRATIAGNKMISNGKLSQAEWHLLWLLKHWPEPDGARPSELAKRLRVTAGNVAQQLRRLEQQAFVVRKHDDTDRRVVLVTLTNGGKKFLAKVRDDFANQFSQLVTRLGPKESKHFTDLLLAAADHLEHSETTAC